MNWEAIKEDGIFAFPGFIVTPDSKWEELRALIDSGAVPGSYSSAQRCLWTEDGICSNGVNMFPWFRFSEKGHLQKLALVPENGALRYQSYEQCLAFLEPLLENGCFGEFSWGTVFAYEIPDYHDDYCGGVVRIQFVR